MNDSTKQRIWEFNGFQSEPEIQPRFMGIVNVTPDSFSDGGRFLDTAAAVEQGLRLVEEGAAFLDVGGESTRPQAMPVAVEEELRRVVPVIEELARRTTVPISIDTFKSEVARAALDAGASIVNDISGLQFDPHMIETCAATQCGVVCMHIQGTPQTMQIAPHYSNVVEEIAAWFAERLDVLERGGIARTRVALDPGIGFGKTAQHNLELLSAVRRFQSLGRPLLIGHSRKRFLQKVIGRPVDERLFGTVGVSVALAHQGVDLIRVHDVAANRDAVLAFLAARGTD